MSVRPLVLLRVRGRTSGKMSTTPVTLVHYGHERWLVVGFGAVNRVRSLHAVGQVYLTHGCHTEPNDVVELWRHRSGADPPAVLQAYHLVPFIQSARERRFTLPACRF
jgi:hypothetical protein